MGKSKKKANGPRREITKSDKTVRQRYSEDQHFSVAVGSQFGARSSCWIFTVQNHSDVYISTSSTSGAWHISLHKSGRWHVRATLPSLNAPVVKAHRNETVPDAYPIGVLIFIPNSSLGHAFRPLEARRPDLWLPIPPADGLTELAVTLLTSAEADALKEEWPGKYVGTKIASIYQLRNGTYLLLLTRSLSAAHSTTKGIVGRIKTPPFQLNSPERRDFAFGKNKEGALIVIEYARDYIPHGARVPE